MVAFPKVAILSIEYINKNNFDNVVQKLLL